MVKRRIDFCVAAAGAFIVADDFSNRFAACARHRHKLRGIGVIKGHRDFRTARKSVPALRAGLIKVRVVRRHHKAPAHGVITPLNDLFA